MVDGSNEDHKEVFLIFVSGAKAMMSERILG
jgi:hypothetical protein